MRSVAGGGGGGARQALAFLTPVGGAVTPTPAALAWFPLVGLALGSAVGGVWWGADRLWPPAVAAAVAVVADIGLTGMLHLDGLVDAADGLLPHLSPARRLEVMAEPTVGAYGVVAGVAVVVLRVAALAALRPSVVLLAALWCLSRTAMAVAAARLPYARAGSGLADAFVGHGRRPGWWAAGGLAMAVALAVVWRPVAGSAVVLAAVLGAMAVLVLGVRRLGGFTGDVLGAAGVVAETVGLVVAAARW